MKRTAQCWSLIAMGDDQQYAGNGGYADDPRRVYRYDSKVANHRNVGAGDLALIRDKERLLGIARIERVESRPGEKAMRRCPSCGTVDLKSRERKVPKYRCANGHEFSEPQLDVVNVTLFEAHYEHSFVEALGAISVAEIKAAAPRPSDQLSIEEIDIRKLEPALLTSSPPMRAVLGTYFQETVLDPNEAAADTLPDPADSSPGDLYVGSMADTRTSVLRSIKLRRGQKTFRDALLRRYGAECVVTGCGVVDVLEAAHIWPYRGESDNHPDNGLVLRADIHTLFDLNLIAINPKTLTVAIAPSLRQAEAYATLEGRLLRVTPSRRPASEPLSKRWRVFEETHQITNAPERDRPCLTT